MVSLLYFYLLKRFFYISAHYSMFVVYVLKLCSCKVRKANKLLGPLSGSVDQLPSKKMYSGQQIDDQKARLEIC